METRVRTYGNWARPRSAGLMGLGSIATVVLFAALILMVLVMMTRGLRDGLIVFVLIALVAPMFAMRDKHGKSAAQRLSEHLGWWRTRATGEHLYQSGPLSRIPWGTCQLPGVAAQLRLSEYQDSYGRPFALIHCPSTNTYAVVLSADPEGSSLVDQDTVDRQVATWGWWLAGLGDQPDVVAAAVTIETAPDTGSRLRHEVDLHVAKDAPAFATEMLQEIVERYPRGSSAVKGYITITFTGASSSKRRGVEDMGHELAARLPGLTASLQNTGVSSAVPISAQTLCEVIRSAYDPAAAPLIDEARAEGHISDDITWSDCGPMTAQRLWDRYIHDSGISCTWSMTGAPRGNVQSRILRRLLSPHSDVPRKRVSLLFRPIDSAIGAAMVEADINTASFLAHSKDRPSARDRLALRAAEATASEEASGAGLVMFGMLVTATVLDADSEDDARAAVDHLAASSRLRLRPVYGTQDSAFAANLPLGLVMSKHLQIPATFRERL